jgi:hypothetical protein
MTKNQAVALLTLVADLYGIVLAPEQMPVQSKPMPQPQPEPQSQSEAGNGKTRRPQPATAAE